MEPLRNAWKKSKIFRVILVAALVWFFLRLFFQIIFTAGFFPELTGDSGLPADLGVYMNTAENFRLHQPIYPQDLTDATTNYPYSPIFAMISEILLWLPARATAMIALLLTVASYVMIYFLWVGIFSRLGLSRVKDQMGWTLPVWLIFAPFWGDATYLNVGLIVVLVTTLLIKAVLEEKLVWTVPLLTFLLISKFMWAFPLAVPLLLGKRKFFLNLIGFTALAYFLLVAIAAIASSPAYILQQYGAYFNHLGRLTSEFPWQLRTVTPYFGLNHSVKQTIIFFLGSAPWVLNLATLIKVILLIPLAAICVRLLRHPPLGMSTPTSAASSLPLDITFLLYLGAFIWLDIVWELLLGIVIFPYLLAAFDKKWEKGLLWSLFLLYALVDVIDLVSYLVGGDKVVEMHGEYILTDPSTYVPLTLFVILMFYAFLVARLWRNSRQLSITG